jgi:glycerate 2-kinase
MIIVAPTSYKETHSAADAARAMAEAARDVTSMDVIELPVSDGGPGLIDALKNKFGGELHYATVSGPLGTPVEARILVQGNTAIIESADACGLHLIPPAERDPLKTTTLGVGELLLVAASYASEIVVGLGGSGTVDGGAGAAKAIAGKQLPPVTALADVRNPLLGMQGAARVFGPQKGASPDAVELLERRLQAAARAMARETGIDVATIAGGGAAGGLGAGLRAYARATLVAGSAWLLDRLGFDALLADAAAVITGEGSYDAQSAMGKVTGEIVARAEANGVPVLMIAGDGRSMLTLDDIRQRVRAGLPGLLAP